MSDESQGEGLRPSEDPNLSDREADRAIDERDVTTEGAAEHPESAEGGDEQPPLSAEEEAAARETAEHDALARVFDDVRSQSSRSALVQPTRWAEIDLVPDHMTPDEFEMFVYEYLEEWKADHADDEVAPAPVYHSATHAVGVPHFFDKKKEKDEGAGEAPEDGPSEDDAASEAGTTDVAHEEGPQDATPSQQPAPSAEEATPEDEGAGRMDVGDDVPADDSASADDDDDPFARLKVPEGYKLVELEGEYVLVPVEGPVAHVELPIVCDHIEVLVGARSYYLYSSDVMTNAYAHWAFLAAEDDKVVTFVDCVREDSRIYPRPFAASNLKNPPFNFDNEDIDKAWDAVRESGQYLDIKQTIASNGDVYYYSTRFLSSVHAASLAEWDAVERQRHL